MVLEFLDKKLTERQEQIVYANALIFSLLLIFIPLLSVNQNFHNVDFKVYILSVGILCSAIIFISNVFVFYFPLQFIRKKSFLIFLTFLLFILTVFSYFETIDFNAILKLPSQNFSGFLGYFQILFLLFSFPLLLVFLEKKYLFVKNLMTLSGKYIYWFMGYIAILSLIAAVTEISFNNPDYTAVIPILVLPYGLYFLCIYKAFKPTRKKETVSEALMPLKHRWLVQLYCLFFFLFFFVNFLFISLLVVLIQLLMLFSVSSEGIYRRLYNKIIERQKTIIYINAFAFIFIIAFNLFLISSYNPLLHQGVNLYGQNILLLLASFALIFVGNVFALYVPLKAIENKYFCILLALLLFTTVYSMFYAAFNKHDGMHEYLLLRFNALHTFVLFLATFGIMGYFIIMENRSLFIENLITVSGKYIYYFIIPLAFVPFLFVAWIFLLPHMQEVAMDIFISGLRIFLLFSYVVYIGSIYKAIRLTMKGTKALRTFMPIRNILLVKLYITYPFIFILFSPISLFLFGL